MNITNNQNDNVHVIATAPVIVTNASVLAPYLPMLHALKAYDLEKKSLTPFYKMMDNMEAPYDRATFLQAVSTLKRYHTFSQSNESLRLTSTRKEHKKRKFQEFEDDKDYIEKKTKLCPLEKVTKRKELRDRIGSFLAPQDLASLSIVSRFFRHVVDQYIADLTEYTCTSRASPKKGFPAGEFTVYVYTHCKEDIYEAWMLQKTRNLRKLSMQSCHYTILLKYCICNFSKLEVFDARYSHICNSVAEALVRNCRHLTDVSHGYNGMDCEGIAVADSFLRSNVLVNLSTNSNVLFLPPTLKRLVCNSGRLGFNFNRLPRGLEHIELKNCYVMKTCVELAKTNLAVKRLILHDASILYDASIVSDDKRNKEFAKFMECRVEFQSMLKRTNLQISISVNEHSDPQMIRILSEEENIDFFANI